MKRRTFVKTISLGSLGVGAGTLKLAASPGARIVAPSDEINVGVIGVGSRGKWMMEHMLRVPGVRFTALCDIYPPRFDEGRALTGEATPVYDDYRKLLDAAGDLDAMLVATPLNHHADHMTACLDSGLHVYGEKSLGFTVEHCDRIVAAAQRSSKHFQVGHQYRYAPWYRKAVERIKAGEIGRVTHIFGYWHRNYNWRRPVPDPSLERLFNWRLYREYSGGLLAELGSHHIDIANWIFGGPPISALGNGGIDFYPDGRETYDNVQVIYNYPEGGKMVFSSLIGNHLVGYQIWIYGTGGSVQLTLNDGFFYYEPARSNSAVPEEMMKEGVNTTSTLSTEGDMPYRGPGRAITVPVEEDGDPNHLAVMSFFDDLRTDRRPFGDEQVGWGSAIAVALGNQAVYDGTPVTFSDHVKPFPTPAGDSR